VASKLVRCRGAVPFRTLRLYGSRLSIKVKIRCRGTVPLRTLKGTKYVMKRNYKV